MIEVKKNSDKIKKIMLDNGLYIVLLLLIAVIIIDSPTFFSGRNLVNILTQSSVRIIIALGVSGLIVTQGTDLSAGRQVGLTGVLSATLLQATDNVNKVFPHLGEISIPVVILIVIIAGGILGLLNGFIIAKMNVTPFIATLGTMTIIYGINSLYYDNVGASPIAGLATRYSHFANGSIDLGFVQIPYLIIYAAIASFIVWILWTKTTFGKNIFAIGGNPEAAKVSGVNVTRNLIIVYVLSGMFYAFGGFLEAARVGSATNNLGTGYELDAIAACVVGGVSFSGGVGTVPGVIIGVIIFQIINYGLTYVGISPYWEYIIKGMIIVAAVALDTLKYRKKK